MGDEPQGVAPSRAQPRRLIEGGAQILAVLKEGEAGVQVAELLRKHGIAAELRRRSPLRALRPLGLAHVSVFSRDLRLRRLKSYGLGPDLICTLSQYRDPRKKIIDILGSRVEIHRGVRIAWNSLAGPW